MLNKTIYPTHSRQFKDKKVNSQHFNKSQDAHGFNVTKNFRVKTEDFHERAFNTRVNSKRLSTINTETTGMYRPEIYHRPEVRKKYFCQLVDSYFNNKKVFEEKVCIRKDKIMQNSVWSRRNNNHKTIQTAFEQQKPNKSLDDKSSKKKRANTAGHTRKKEQPRYLKEVNEKDRDVNINNYLNEQQLDQIKRKSSGNAQLRFNSYLKNKINNKLVVLNSYLKTSHKKITKKQQDATPFRRCLKNDPGIDSLESSIINESQGYYQKISEIPLYTNEKLVESRENIVKKISKRAHQSKYKQTSVTVNSSFQDTKSRLKSNSSRESIFSVRKNIKIEYEIKEQQKKKLQKQINSRLKIINPEYGQLKWKFERVHNYKLYKICDISGCDETNYNISNKKDVSLKKNDSFGSVFGKRKKQLIHLKIKKFEEDSVAGNIKNTIQKAYHFGVSQLWKQVPKDPLVQNSEQYNLFYSINKKSLRQQLFQFAELQKSKQQKSPIYNIRVTSVYHQLFHNNCQYFKDIIRSVASDLVKMNGKIINNKISLDNLYRLQEKAIKIGDWGCSAVCRTIKVNGSDIIFRDLPILKYEDSHVTDENIESNWLLHPQNLAPQIIQCLIEENYSKIWEKQHCPQIWNLGILIFEILTWVPVWIPYQAQVEHKIPKYGYFYDNSQRLSQIYALQCKIPAIISRWTRDQKNSPIFKHISPEILSLMKSMLQINISLRPKPEQVIKKLQAT